MAGIAPLNEDRSNLRLEESLLFCSWWFLGRQRRWGNHEPNHRDEHAEPAAGSGEYPFSWSAHAWEECSFHFTYAGRQLFPLNVSLARK